LILFIIDKIVADFEATQSDAKILAMYEALKDEPKIRWKASIKKVVQLPESDFGDAW